MNQSIQALIIQLSLSLVVSIVTALITVKLSTRQFYSQRWWEQKAESYSKILEDLSRLQYSFGEWIDEESENRKFSDKKKEKLSEDYGQSRETLEKLRAVGAFYISEDAAQILDELFKLLYQADSEESWIHMILQSYEAVKECIEKIRKCAKDDLKIR